MRTFQVFLLASCAALMSSSALAGESESQAAAAALLDDLHDAAAAADGERYFGTFAEDASFIGTDAGERWSLAAFRDYAMPYFDSGQGWAYEPVERQLTLGPGGNTAWFHELLRNDKYGLARGTGVLVKQDGDWKVAQYHLAFPIPNELAGEITRRIKAWRE